MNKALFIVSAIAVVFITSCDKESSGTIHDFSNTLPAYVDLTGAGSTVDVAPGDTASVTLVMRNAIQQDVTITYSVSAPVGATDQTFTIPRNLLRGTGKFKIPDDALGTSDTVTATLNITKAATADGQLLTLGRYNDPASQTITYSIAE